MTRRLRQLLPVAAATTLVVGTLLACSGVPVLRDPADPFGRPLEPFGVGIGVTWMLLAAAGLVAAGRARTTPVLLLAVLPAALLVDQSVLAALGYLPMVLVEALTGDTADLTRLSSPGLALQALIVAAVVVRLLAVRDGLADPVRSGRLWTRVAIEAPLVYAVTRLLMWAGAPGFGGGALGPQMRSAALGLALASIAGALLTTGLDARWGERWWWWTGPLRGRPIPVSLAVVPALVVAVAVLSASRVIAVQIIAPGSSVAGEMAAHPLVLLPHVLWPLWAAALVLAALAHRQRRASPLREQPGLGSSGRRLRHETALISRGGASGR